MPTPIFDSLLTGLSVFAVLFGVAALLVAAIGGADA